MADYPSSIFSASANQPNTNDVLSIANFYDVIADEIEAIETEVGTSPSGSYSTLKARVEAIEDNNIGLNLIINGNHDIDQENVGSVTGLTDGDYMADMVQYGSSGTTAVLDYTQSSTVPDDKSQNALLLTVTTSDASVAAGDLIVVRRFVEGYDYFPYHNGQSVTFSFWVRSSVTGDYGVSFKNSAGNRNYLDTITVNTANTYEKKTVTLATDTSGTWDFTNGIGLRMEICLMGGTNYQGSTGVWSANDDRATSSQVNFASSVSNTFYLSQVKLEPGSVATPFISRQFQRELSLCQRYYQKSYNLAVAPGTATAIGRRHTLSDSSGNIRESTEYATHMRANANITIYATTTGASGFVDDGASTYAIGGTEGAQSSYFVSVSSMPSSANSRWQWVADARF